ncbi:MAG: hypothetical protein J2P38_08435, partial [Candidatus Dormibacteraeota bacterium]|nr:hypothetical protein [Candidatus Dormibacteraeota bacterium]
GGGDLYRAARDRRRRAAAVYSAAGAIFSAALALASLLGPGLKVHAPGFLALFSSYLWPLVLTLVLVVATTRRTKALILVVYVIGYVVITPYVYVRNPATSAAWLFFLDNVPPTCLFLIFLLRRVRAVGPLTVAFFLFATAGTELVNTVLLYNFDITRVVASILFALGATGFWAFVAVNVMSFTVFALIGWVALLALRRAYRAKWVNDQSLVVDALWLFFALYYAVDLASDRPLWALAGPVAFGLYLVTVRCGFPLLMPRRAARGGTTLLVLRVFSLGKKSEKLFESMSRHWRYAGPVQLLAGPDLAETTVEPYQFLDFVTGRLARQFISDQDALSRRIQELDTRPDFDGRFRINDFFCRAHTWQATVAAMVEKVDAVFMDLRGFTSARLGSTYEIQQLLLHIPVSRIILLTDATTDHAFLEQTAIRAWNALPAGAPNREVQDPRLTIIEAGRNTERSLGVLLAALSQAATAGPLVASRSLQPAVP